MLSGSQLHCPNVNPSPAISYFRFFMWSHTWWCVTLDVTTFTPQALSNQHNWHQTANYKGRAELPSPAVFCLFCVYLHSSYWACWLWFHIYVIMWLLVIKQLKMFLKCHVLWDVLFWDAAAEMSCPCSSSADPKPAQWTVHFSCAVLGCVTAAPPLAPRCEKLLNAAGRLAWSPWSQACKITNIWTSRFAQGDEEPWWNKSDNKMEILDREYLKWKRELFKEIHVIYKGICVWSNLSDIVCIIPCIVAHTADNSSHLAVSTACRATRRMERDHKLLNCCSFSQYLITRPSQEKPSSLNSEPLVYHRGYSHVQI